MQRQAVPLVITESSLGRRLGLRALARESRSSSSLRSGKVRRLGNQVMHHRSALPEREYIQTHP